jgi:hypothetical protein
MASADVEITVGVRPNGSVATAEVGTTRDVEGSTAELRLGFQTAALAAARDAKFICKRCRRERVSYSIVYRFRFNGVLIDLDQGYRSGGSPSSSTRATIIVPADVPVLDAALNIRAETLPSACRLAPAQRAIGELTRPGNPSSGENRQLISGVRARITGRVDDLASRYELQLVEGVTHAYVGRYIDERSVPIAVYGLLFGDTNDAKAFVELATTSGAHAFVVHRQIVVALRERTACGDAIGGLLKTRAEERTREIQTDTLAASAR